MATAALLQHPSNNEHRVIRTLACPHPQCYSHCAVSTDGPVKALLIAVAHDPEAAVYSINRLTPDCLCFFLPDPKKHLVETQIQPHIAKMPNRWDWIVTEDPESFVQSHRSLTNHLPDMLKTWEVAPGELVLDISSATVGMASAMVLVGLPMTSNVVLLGKAAERGSAHSPSVVIDGQERTWTQGNPLDERGRSCPR